MNLTQLAKGFNLHLFIGYTSTDMMAADLATKYYRGLVATINSHLWRNGSMDGVIPLLDDSNTFLLTHGGKVVWTGQNEHCHHLTCPDIDNFFCSCPSCNTTFWAGYANLFSGDSIESLDLEPDHPTDTDPLKAVDTNPRKVDDSEHLKVTENEPLKEKDATRDSNTLPEFELGNGDKSIFDATNNSASNSSGKSSTTSKTTPQSNPGHQLIADVNSKHSTADNSSISSSKPACDAKTTTTGDVFYNLDPVLSAEPKHATGFTTARSNSTAERNYNVIAQSAYEYHTAKYPELFNFHFVDLSGDMYDEWPQVFHQLSQRAYEATTREDGIKFQKPGNA